MGEGLTMPRKSKEEYNEYMKGYMQKRYQDKKGLKVLHNTDDTNKPELDFQGKASEDIIKLSKEVFKDKETGEPDKIIMYIEKAVEYLPLAMKFINGFAENMKAFNAQNPKQVTEEQTIQPPEGWVGASPMEKLKYKYNRPSWYEAGLRYDEYKETGLINPQININHVDKTYTPPQSRRPTPLPESSEPKSLNDLSKKYGESKPEPIIDSPEMHDPKLEKVVQDKQKKSLTKDKSTGDTKMEDITNALNQDNLKYIQMAINFLGNMPMPEFKSKIDKLDELLEKNKFMIALLPIHLKELLINTPDEELLNMFKQNCADKYNWCKKNKHMDKLVELFTKLKSMLK